MSSTTSIQNAIRVVIQSGKTKKAESIPIKNEHVKLSLFTDNVAVCVENPVQSTGNNTAAGTKE